MPKIFEKDGFSFFFYMNEHEPVHVHVRKQGKIAKFEIVNGCAEPVFGKLSNADKQRTYREKMVRNFRVGVIMNEITEKDVKRLWVEKDAVCVELKDGRIGRELIRDYEPLRKATRKQLENCRVDCDGVWFDDLDEGLELSGFFSPKKTNPIGRVFWLFPELNASAFARRLGIPQPLFAAYVNGTKKPSSARKKLIDEELRRIGKELLKTVA